ncbi:MAG: imidazole glycerol phosphate synthase subunit HisH [Chitinophagaceae bacterium]
MKIVIADYKLGNMFSVRQALLNIGADCSISYDGDEIRKADAIVLPGVGAFKDAMNNLTTSGVGDAVKEAVNAGKPFLGICLGLQLLLTESEEFGASKGLNLIPGKVIRFNNFDNEGNTVRVPQIGWNTIEDAGYISWAETPLKHLKQGEYMYFVHSFFVVPDNPIVAVTKTSYGNTTYTSCIQHENIFACQFHPEKSAAKGLTIYENWIKSIK